MSDKKLFGNVGGNQFRLITEGVEYNSDKPDGYDYGQHVWIEFDPPHHYYVNGILKPKDIIRQENIINHFVEKQCPLKKFIRVKSTPRGDVLSLHEVYKGGI